jgi:hypothetical protein
MIHHAAIGDEILRDLFQPVGEVVGVDEQRLEDCITGIHRIASQMHDGGVGQRLVDQAAVAEVERQLVDRVALPAGQVADRRQVAAPHVGKIHLQRRTQQVRVAEPQARVRSARA